MSEKKSEVTVATVPSLELANVLRKQLSQAVDHIWVLVSATSVERKNFEVAVMNSWGASPAKDELQECLKIASKFQEDIVIEEAKRLDISPEDEDILDLDDFEATEVQPKA